jgi:hypothetical protein
VKGIYALKGLFTSVRGFQRSDNHPIGWQIREFGREERWKNVCLPSDKSKLVVRLVYERKIARCIEIVSVDWISTEIPIGESAWSLDKLHSLHRLPTG